MAFKPNYNFQKAERDRAKLAKKEAKAREKDEAKRRAAAGEPPLETEPEADALPSQEDSAA